MDSHVYSLATVNERGLWWLAQVAPPSVSHVPLCFETTVTADKLAAFLETWRGRHEALRSTFHFADGQITRRVTNPPIDFRTVVDAREFFSEPFDLANGPLWRAAQAGTLFLISLHHIICDAWSGQLLANELAAFLEGKELPPAPAALTATEATVSDADLAPWREALAEVAPVGLPRGGRPSSSNDFAGRKHFFTLPAETRAALGGFCRTRRATPFMALLTAYGVTLARRSGDPDVVIGTVHHNRATAERQNVFGYLADATVLRPRYAAGESLEAAFAKTRETILDTMERRHVPYEKLQAAGLGYVEGRGRALYNCAFSLNEFPPFTKTTAAGTITLRDPNSWDLGTTKFSLTLYFWREGDGLAAALEYDSHLFGADDAAAFADDFRRNLAELLAGDARPLLGRPSVTDARTVYDLVMARVAETPSRVAVADAVSRLSFVELDARAEALAFHLAALGAGPEKVVALVLPRTVDFVVAALASWKTGAAYVGIDPKSPAARLEQMIRDASPVAVLDATKLSELAGPAAAVSLPGVTSADQAAYLVYTSGSTGTPKAITVEHRGLLNLTQWVNDFYRFDSADRVSLCSGLAFDVAALEIWPTLASGASVHIASDEVRMSTSALVEWLGAERITVLSTSTPIAERLLERDLSDRLPLRLIWTGGDQLRRRPKAGARFRLFNHYGPAEATVMCTAGEVVSETEDGALPDIGHAIAGAALYVLDANQQPVADGEVGELYIGGVGVARGYCARPELTAERFLADPHRAGARMYRTGDKVRRLPTRALEFHGRADRQVKIRGIRIELGEIENALASIAGVGECTVVPRVGSDGEKELTGYYTGEATVETIGTALRARLPEAMVPRRFVRLATMPLTQNGKVDVTKLPEPGRDEHAPTAPSVPAATARENAIAEIWRKVLDLGSVNVEKNFFELGGHSLKLALVQEAIYQKWELKPSLVDLFAHPTVRGLAKFLDEQSGVSTATAETSTDSSRGRLARAATLARGRRVSR